MKSQKLTQKKVQAARLVASFVNSDVAEVIANFSREEMYQNLKERGYRWNSKISAWSITRYNMDVVPRANYGKIPVSLRLMTEEHGDTEIVLRNLAEMLKDAGVEIVKRSEPRANYDGRGGRAYIDILL